MKKALIFLGAFVGGTLGWMLGDGVGLMTAFVLSMVGTGVGVYAGNRIAQRYEI
jgi:uncharacterized protein YcfJ